MAQITYTDKVAINENPNVADINKVKADDMNEIKSVVNENDSNIGSLSNLNTTDKSNIVNAINESLIFNDWKLVNSVTARTYITIPDGAKEIKMITNVNDTQYTVDLLVARLSTTYKYIKLNGDTNYVHYEYNGTGIRCVQAYVSGQSDINNTTTYMYYK